MLTYIQKLVRDILCISIDVDVDNVVQENEKLTINYSEIYNSERFKQVILINKIWKSIFNTFCPKFVVFSILEKKISSINGIIDYLYQNSFMRFRLKQSDIENLKIKKYEVNNMKEEFVGLIKDRYQVEVNTSNIFKDLCSAKIRFIDNQEDEISKKFINPINKSILEYEYNIDNFLENDLISFSFFFDNCINRILASNIIVYINGDPTTDILKFLECLSNSTSIVILYTTFSERYRKYAIDCYEINNENIISMIPSGIIKTFVSINSEYSPGIFNYIILDDQIINHEPFIRTNDKYLIYLNISQSMNKCNVNLYGTETGFSDDIYKHNIKLISGNNARQLMGTYYLMKFYDHVSNNDNLINMQYNLNNTPNTILIIDNRCNPLNIITLAITLFNLQKCWDVTFVGSLDSIEYMKKHFGNIINFIHNERLDNKFHIEDYNFILKDSEIYKKLDKLGYKRCLVIQDDSAILKPGLEDSSFMNYDYIGSPWADVVENNELKNHLCGNGGLSIRNISKMIETIETFSEERNELFNNRLQIIPEDVYFAKYVKKIGQVPNEKDARLFGSEQILTNDSFGFHKIWIYPGDIQGFFEGYIVNYYMNSR